MHALKRLAVATSIAALALSGCGSSSPADAQLSSAAKVGGGATFALSGTVSGAIAEGVTISLVGQTASGATVTASTATGRRGQYAFKNVQNGTYTVTPSADGYAFYPASCAVTVSGSDTTRVDFISSKTHVISGTVGGAPADGVIVTLASGTGTPSATLTDATGRYTFTGVLDGTYTITPSKPGFVFSPAELDVTVSGSDLSGQDFTASVPTHAISGSVVGAAVEGVTVTLWSSLTGSLVTTTDAAGHYVFAGLYDGFYQVTPSKSGYYLSPSSFSLTLSGSDVTLPDITASALHFISGTVSGVVSGGLLVSLSNSVGGLLQQTTTDAAGHYTFAGLRDGSYVVRPSNSSYAFSPTSASVTVSGSDVPNVDFVSAVQRFTISGTVGGATAEGVTLTLALGSTTNVVATTTTDALGNYAFTDLLTGSYAVTPAKAGYVFSPNVRWVTLSSADATGQSFTAAALHAITGSVVGSVLDGVAVSLLSRSSGYSGPTGPQGPVLVTDASGAFRFDQPAGAYTLTPARTGYSFSPAARDVDVSGGDVAMGPSFTSSALSYAPVCSADRWCWESPAPQGNPLNGIFAASPADVWLVGAAGTALHWDGTTWIGVPTGTTRSLLGAWGTSSSDVWAVGGDPSTAGSGVVLHWDGTAWSTWISGTAALYAVWGSSANDVWTVGSSGTILHWNGSAWSSVASGTTATLSSVWGSAADDIWAVGYAGTLHWNGTAWSSASAPSYATAIWGSSANDVWAVTQTGSVMHWDGTAWSIVRSSTSGALTAVWGSSPNDVWAVGSAYALHWDGTAWSLVSTGSGGTLNAIGGTSAGDVWFAGLGGTILHWDGSGLSGVVSAGTRMLFGVWGSSADDVWAVGSGGANLHWDGSAWSNVASGTPSQLYGVWGSAANDVWAVGVNTIVHWDGRSWSPALTTAPGYLYAVWGAAPNDVWAVGGATSQHWDGTAWSPVAAGTTNGLVAIWGSASNDVWAVGYSGTIVHWNGSSWSRVSVPTTASLSSVWGSAAADVWAVVSGSTGPFLHWNGTAWYVVTASELPLGYVKAIWGAAANDIWAVCTNGTIAHWDGSAWSRTASGTSAYLAAVWGSSSADVWAVGATPPYASAILRRRP